MSASSNGSVVVNISARTDVGMCRRGNEDCFMVADLTTGNVGLVPEVSTHELGDHGSLLVVSDGMGGAVAGEIASDLSVKGVREELIRTAGTMNVSDRLCRAVESANRAVWQYAQEHPQLAGMGATMTAVLCHQGTAYVAQVGDSRAYIVRTGRIKQLTKDQSLVQLLVEAGAIRPDQVDQVPNNVILQALGTRAEVIVAMTSIELCRDDRLLVCSDGLSNKMSAEEMRDVVVNSGDDLSGVCRRLTELANSRGGEDNITIVVARFDGDSLESAAERRITGSMHALTPDDLLRIGGAQLDYLHDPASDAPQPRPNVNAVLEDLNVTLVPGHPRPAGDDHSVTQVGFPAISSSLPEVVVPRAPAPPPATPAPAAGANRPSHANKILLAIGIVLIGLALFAGAAFAIYWFVILPRLTT